MYEQVSHSLLNKILFDLKPEIHEEDLRHFYTRLGTNFYSIHSLFSILCGNPHLFFFSRFEHDEPTSRVLAVGNFERQPQHLNLEDIGRKACFRNGPPGPVYRRKTGDVQGGTGHPAIPLLLADGPVAFNLEKKSKCRLLARQAAHSARVMLLLSLPRYIP